MVQAGSGGTGTGGSIGVSGWFAMDTEAGAAGADSPPHVDAELPTCSDGSTTCDGRDVYTCHGPDELPTYLQTCKGSTHCDPSYFHTDLCIPDVCEPGKKGCVDNAIKTCTSGGFYPEKAGHSCGVQVCVDGSCQPQICKPKTDLCRDGDIHQCDELGASSTLQVDCGDGATCGNPNPDAPFFVACVPFDCLPGTPTCLNNQGGICDANGRALTVVAADCAFQQQVCDSAGVCGASVVDTLPSTKVEINPNPFDRIDVHSSRRLTKVSVDVGAQAKDITVQWQLSSDAGLLTTASSVVKAGATTASTSELSYVLEAGNSYKIGASFSDLVEVAFEVPSLDPVLSFGRVNSKLQNGRVYAMSITTEFP